MKPVLWFVLLTAFVVFTACGLTPNPAPTDTPLAATHTVTPKAAVATLQPPPTPTPTPEVVAVPPTATPRPPDVCQGLSGTLEVQVLVGPADAVGLEPEAVGTVPWSVTTDAAPYTLAGATFIDYQETLARNWGTFDVQMALDVDVTGTCEAASDSGMLTMAVTMDGEQLVTVTSEGFSGEYPWEGVLTRDVTFPIEEGASAEGEGWALVLHLD